MIVVATSADELAGMCERLEGLGAGLLDVVEPSDARRVILAAVDDERNAANLVASLQAEGVMAVMRPDGGAALQAWFRNTRPVVFGKRLSVCAAWSEHDRSGLVGLVELGPGGFGSGHHPTTRQMIEALVKRVSGGERVLDVGCGSGILGLCALKLGAASVVAVDVKPDAVEAALRNARINAMDDQLEATLAGLGEFDGLFDVVVANIARAGIVELARELVAHVSPGGWLAVAGISPSQCSQVVDFLHPLVEVERATAGEWSSLVLANSEPQITTPDQEPSPECARGDLNPHILSDTGT